VIFVGDDWAEDHHDVDVMDGDGGSYHGAFQSMQATSFRL
jgi:hypothetical protein